MTVIELEAEVLLWRNCERKIAQHQSFKIGDKTFQFADLAEVEKVLQKYETRLAKAKSTKRSRAMRFVHE